MAHRVTVIFNATDYKLIKAEIARRTRERGYPVTVSESLRELVRENWKPSHASK
jgi:hypothetical protein